MIKQKNKLFSAVLAAGLFLTGCGGNGANNTAENTPADSTTTETVQTESTGNPDNSATISVAAHETWVPSYERAIERLKEKYPKATVEIIEIDGLDHLELIGNTDASNPDVADLFSLPADRLEDMVLSDNLMPIDAKSLADKIGGWDDFESGLSQAFVIDGEYFGFPRNVETLFTYVNTANAADKGIDPDATIELNELDDPELVLLPFFNAWYGVAATNTADISLLAKEEDGTLYTDLTKDWSELEDDKKAVMESLYNYWKLHNDAGTPLFDADAGWAYIDDKFTTGNGGVFRISGSWDINLTLEQAGEENLGIYPIDKITVAGKPLAHWKSGWGYALNSRIEDDADKQELAFAMIEELQNPEYAAQYFNETGHILENVSLDAYQASDEIVDVNKEVIKATLESYELAADRPVFREWNQVWDTWQNAVLSWNSTNPASAEEGYEQIKASFQALMDNFAQ